jgi:outer membrane protein OmpA-like peptidoglycan-associated protein
MNIKKSILSCMLMLGFVSASAQDPEVKTEFVFNPHWYVQVQPVGGQYTLGEVGFGDLFSYNVQAALGYQFNKVLGARLAVNAWQSKGGTDYDAPINQKYTWGWKYVAPTVDLTANLSNLFCGYNPNRVVNVSFFAGLGANIGFSNDEANDVKAALDAKRTAINNTWAWTSENMDYIWDGSKPRLVGQAGLMVDFRINDRFSFGLEAGANVLNDHYNSKRAGNADWYFNGLAGLKVNLGSTYTTREVKGCEPRIIEKVVEKTVEKPVYVDKIVEVEKKAEPLRRDVFFSINSSRIAATEDSKILDIVAYLNANPNAKVTITGYADKGTGNARINERLGKARAKIVTDRLVKVHKIDPARIITDSKGDTEQPFAENNKNRVSICIAE